ncbi:MAG: undecaprenyldiphospho-muramoylpentapeptide beta-N-acetylglucosaminyltransferase [Clostridia bacterium]|nr:undecaprenyldiphospho-muramoylpentapeptide beta-N-acetylglucosaminyltransferase [Clostridia bacterium]
MRVILTGGGTGGHIYPAIAIGQALQKEWARCEILYVGTKNGLENKIIPEVGFPLVTLEVEGWQRKFSLQASKAGWKASKAFFAARKIIRDFSPQLVIGTGGYVCLPVVGAASCLGITTLLHEQNALPGLTNRLLSGGVEEILLTFPEAQKYFSVQRQKKITVTGLPIRPAILEVERAEGLSFFDFSPDKLTLLGIGGSRGAQSINQAMLFVCGQYYNDERVQIIHLTGETGYAEFQQKLQQRGIDMANNGNVIITPYLQEMEYALACTDLCVARSGAAFLAEMTAKGIPGILVPYPYAAESHQEHNARALVEQGAAEMILDQELTGEVLLEKVEKVLFNDVRRKEMAQKSKQTGEPEAIAKIIEVVKKHLEV